MNTRIVQTESASSLFNGDDALTPLATGRDFEYGACINEFKFVCAEGSGVVFLQQRPVTADL